MHLFVVSDELFGFCKDGERGEGPAGGGDREYNFRLSAHQLLQLQEQILILIQRGLTWKDALTQCVLQNTLVAFAFKRAFNPNSCEEALLSLSDDVATDDVATDVKDDISAVLQKLLAYQGEGGGYSTPLLLKKSVDDLTLGLDGRLTNSNKRDEFVQIHKYFDQSKGQLKRDPFLMDENFLSYLSPYGSPRPDADVRSANVPVSDDSPQFDSRIQSYVDAIERLSSLREPDDQLAPESRVMVDNSILVQNSDDRNRVQGFNQNSDLDRGQSIEQSLNEYIDQDQSQMYPTDDVDEFLRSQIPYDSQLSDEAGGL